MSLKDNLFMLLPRSRDADKIVEDPRNSKFVCRTTGGDLALAFQVGSRSILPGQLASFGHNQGANDVWVPIPGYAQLVYSLSSSAQTVLVLTNPAKVPVLLLPLTVR